MTDLEKQIINENEVYEVLLNDKIYFHIQDLEDGDFIAIDYKKKVFKITHDPFAISQLSPNLSEFFQLKE